MSDLKRCMEEMPLANIGKVDKKRLREEIREKVKLPAHRAGLPGKACYFILCPLCRKDVFISHNRIDNTK